MRSWVVKWVVVGAAACGLAGGAAAKWWPGGSSDARSFKVASIERGELRVAISATGTLEPEEVIDVGAQVAGKIQEFGRDPASGEVIDYGSPVEEGAVLARIDPALFEQEVNLAKAMYAKAQARLHQSQSEIKATESAVVRSEAVLAQTRAKLELADRDFARTRRLYETKVITDEQFDLHQSTVDTNRAAVLSDEATIVQSKIAVEKAKAAAEEAEADLQSADATLKRAQQNLQYTTIRAPIKGVIIDRRVNIGQTVVASLNAPSLFLIAKDLRRLQVWASVNEADIGRLAPGQRVTFNVDAFPNETFTGQVKQIRLNASMTQNVVTYTVVVDVENEGNKLLPYLTANVKFEVAQRDNALLVPNAALNWKPRRELIVESQREAKSPKSAVWVRDGRFVRAVPVKALDSDGTRTEIVPETGSESGSGSGTPLAEGAEVIVGENRAAAGTNVVNPLLPQMQGKKKE